MKIVYLDCFCGIAGDMLLAALIDAGAPATEVQAILDHLSLPGWELNLRTVTKAGIRATKATVDLTDGGAPRSYREIRTLLERADLPQRVGEPALSAFEILATAEAAVHGVPLEEIHLHEAGAVDAIVDIVGSCAALSLLDSERVHTSPLPLGSGVIEAAHGALPVPAPAVVEILRGVPIRGGGEGELVTPTGAALAKALTDEFGAMPAMKLKTVGYGAGDREGRLPNVLRVLVGEAEAVERTEEKLIETNLDDMTPELIPYVVDALLTAGARDAWTTPIVMKRGRPALTLSILVGEGDFDLVLDVLYRETTTLGARISAVSKDALDRSWVEVEVEGQGVRVKLGARGGEITTASVEYADAARAARATGLPLKEVYRRALLAARDRV